MVTGRGSEGVAQAPKPESEIFGRAPLAGTVPAIRAGGVSLEVTKPADVVHGRAVFAAGASTGRHVHPGPGLVQVKSGALTMFKEDCSKVTFKAGQAFVDRPNELLLARNDSEDELVIFLSFVLPRGAELSIPRAGPEDCPETR